MIRYFVLLFLSPFLFQCTEANESIQLSITNRSTNQIDSVKIPGYLNAIEKILVGETRTIEVDIPKSETYKEAMHSIRVYMKGKTYHAVWGLTDWGRAAKKQERLYVFNNGINDTDQNLKKPDILSVYIANRSGLPIDSVVLDPSSLKAQYKNDPNLKLELNYSEFEKNPVLKIFQQGNAYPARIDHDWENWNETQEILYLHPNGQLSKTE